MKKSSDPDAIKAARALEDARRSGDVRYFEARATVTGKGETAALGEVKVKEFDMSGGK